MKIVLDTSVFVPTFLDFAEESKTPRVKIFRALQNKSHKLVLSNELESQILRVVNRVEDKDFAGLFRHVLWSDFSIEYVIIEEHQDLRKKWREKVPRKDLDIFITAIAGNADALISEDENLVKKARVLSKDLEVMTPQEFVKEHHHPK
ncbi:hypothetical protein AKJ58_00500 [candidate division MSBL1 archaeon SCGC-AAA385D11]|uniref:PIN domain-containing protein n=1 Tax=candidate division MSBL1 archaeon SCGC-AAA385D11 TaxID=1698286 RepID=A0A133VPD4_9EURY|nr:hypothetical protein AKJ58_00500 [candidate division MSBL1 archaeon SCGC-AAA385D11]